MDVIKVFFWCVEILFYNSLALNRFKYYKLQIVSLVLIDFDTFSNEKSHFMNLSFHSYSLGMTKSQL